MTKQFPIDMKRIWKKEGFKIISIKLHPIDNEHIEWTIIGERIPFNYKLPVVKERIRNDL